jgi:predicted lipid-binding transport protein (Tim44 family)
MNKSLSSFLLLCAALFTLGTLSPDAEAGKRLGGGKSFGMTRNTTTTPAPSPTQTAPSSATTTQQALPPKTATPQSSAPAPQAPKRNWLGPIAGLAAGIGLAALLSHFGMGEGVANVLMIALLAFAAIFVVRLLFRKSAPQDRMQYAGAGSSYSQNTHFEPVNLGAGDTPPPPTPSTNVPGDFDVEGFLRQAKLNFVRLQAANDRGDMEDIKNFTRPEVFAEIQMQYEERGKAVQRTDVVQLNADLIELATEATQHIASVRFHGLLREDADASPIAFDEIWNLTKPIQGAGGWLVAGIQQPH